MSIDGLVSIDGIDSHRWMTALDPALNISPQVQADLASVFVDAIKSYADDARCVLVPPPRLPPGVMGMQVFRTRVYVRVQEIRSFRLSLFAGLLAAQITNSPPVGITATAAATLIGNILQLEDHHVEMLAKIRRLTGGRLYTDWLGEDEIIASWPEPDCWDPRKILADLKSFGVLEEAAGLWRAVR